MMMQKFIARTVLTLALLTTASPALASDFSGIFVYLIVGFLLGLAFACAVGWVISLFVEDVAIKWIIRGLSVGAYLLFAFAAMFGLGF